MSDRTYRLVMGALLLMFLYFNLHILIFVLIAILLSEGATNVRVTHMAMSARHLLGMPTESQTEIALSPETHCGRFDFEAERAWRLITGSLLLTSYALFHNLLWFFPWFMGFALLGAGVSGVCPVLLSVKWLGFK